MPSKKNKMKKSVFLLTAMLPACSVWAADRSVSISLDEARPGQSSSVASSTSTSDTVMVIGKGVGDNRVESLKAAYNDAVETAVGMWLLSKSKGAKNEAG